ncbi:hypothetical protein YC2023_097830 [Brassica napus]
MANTRVFFSDLKSGGKCSSVVEARLLRYWEAQNVKRGGDLMWVDTRRREDVFPLRFRCTQNYRLTNSPFLIRFSDLTDFDELTDLVSPLPNSLSYFQECNSRTRETFDVRNISRVAAADTSWRYVLVQLEGLSPYRFCKSHHTRDVKSANVLLDEKFMAKVSELGLPKTGPYLDQTYVSLAVKGSFGYVLDQVEVKDDKTTIVHAYPRLASWDQRCILVWMEWDIWQGVSMRSFCSNSGNRRQTSVTATKLTSIQFDNLFFNVEDLCI